MSKILLVNMNYVKELDSIPVSIRMPFFKLFDVNLRNVKGKT